MIETIQSVNRFWFQECDPKDWYNGGAALDATIRDRFAETWQAAHDGALDHWTSYPNGALAFLVLTDQFPRNMFRDSARAFATDERALAVAKRALRQSWDLQVDDVARQFFYLPLEHSETTPDQHRAVRLFVMRGNSTELLLHARAHRAVIRRYGRFPYRNAALGRDSTPAEAAMVDEGGYGAVLRAVQKAG